MCLSRRKGRETVLLPNLQGLHITTEHVRGLKNWNSILGVNHLRIYFINALIHSFPQRHFTSVGSGFRIWYQLIMYKIWRLYKEVRCIKGHTGMSYASLRRRKHTSGRMVNDFSPIRICLGKVNYCQQVFQYDSIHAGDKQTKIRRFTIAFYFQQRKWHSKVCWRKRIRRCFVSRPSFSYLTIFDLWIQKFRQQWCFISNDGDNEQVSLSYKCVLEYYLPPPPLCLIVTWT